MASRLITAPYNAFDLPGAVWQTFDPTTGVLIEEITCTDPPLSCTPNIYPFTSVVVNGVIYGNGFDSTGFYAILIFSNNLIFLSSTQPTPPDPEFLSGAPEVLSDHSGHLFGLWQVLNIDGINYDTTLVQLDPDTLAQTVLWSNFQPEIAGDRPYVFNSYAMSPTGSKFYYTTGIGGYVLQLDIATGVTTNFVTAPAGSGTTSPSHFVSVNPQGRVFISWTDPGGFDRVIIYESDGSTVLNADFDEELQRVFSAPDPDGLGFWVMGLVIGTGVVWELRHYSLPGGVLDTAIEVPAPAGTDPGNNQYYQLQYLVETTAELTCGPGNGLTITGTALDVENLAIMSPTGDIATYDVVSSSSTSIIVNNLSPVLSSGEWCIAFQPGIPKASLVFSDGTFVWFVSIDGDDLIPPPSAPVLSGFSTSLGGVLSYSYDDDGGYVIADALDGQAIFDAQFVAGATNSGTYVGAGTNHNDSYYVVTDSGASNKIQKRNRITGALIHEYATNFYPNLAIFGQIAVSPDGNTAYLATGAVVTDYHTKIQQYNLAAETGPVTWVTGTNQGGGIDTLFPSTYGPGIITLVNGDVLAIWNDTTSGNSYIARYNSSGTELNRYPFSAGTVPQALTTTLNELSFMVLSGVSSWASGIVQHIRIADGATINSFTVPPFEGARLWSSSAFAMVTVWINEWLDCVVCGSGPTTPNVTTIVVTPVSGSCLNVTLTITGTDLVSSSLVMKGPDDLPVTFSVISASSTTIVIGSLSPAFTTGEYCVGFELGVYPFCFNLVCSGGSVVTSVVANCSEDPITLNITGTNMVSSSLVIQGPDDLPVTVGIIFDTPTLIKVVITPAFTSGEYCFGFDPGVYPYCFELLCVPTIINVVANCTEIPISLNITGFAMNSADLIIKGPDGDPVSFGVIFDTVTLIKVGALSPPFTNGEYCFGFEPDVYIFCGTLNCLNLSSGIYFLDPTATHDTLYVSFSPVVTSSVKIP